MSKIRTYFLSLGNAKKGKDLPEWYDAPDLNLKRFGKGHVKKLKLLSKLAGKGKVLDIGYYYKPNPFLNNAYGIDLKDKLRPKNYKTIKKWSLGEKIPFENETFDSVIIGETLMYINSFKVMHNTLSEANRVLKKGGKLIISEFNPFYYYNFFAHFFSHKKEINFIMFTENNTKNIMEKEYGFKLLNTHGDFIEIFPTNLSLSLNWPKWTYHTIYELKKEKHL